MKSTAITPASLHPAFIVLEGIDGCGKSTQVQLLAEWLTAAGHSVVVTREPGGTALAESLRAIILDAETPCSARAELMLILAARAQHVAELIKPALQQGAFVISDRFSLSSLAYQGYGRGLALEDIRIADAVARDGISPALTLWLDVPLTQVLARIGERADRFEGEGREFLQRVIDGYSALAENETTIYRLDGTASADEVTEQIQKLLLHANLL